MYFIIKTTKKRTKVKNDSFEGFEFVPKGTKIFQIHNGTIGKGARYKNFKLTDIRKALK